LAATCPWCGTAIIHGTPITEADEAELDDQQQHIGLYLLQRGGRFTEEELLDELADCHAAQGITAAKLSEALRKLVQYGVLYQTSSEGQTVYVVFR